MKLSRKQRGRKQANPKSAKKGKEKIVEEVETQLQRPKQSKKGEKNRGKKETTRKQPEASEPPNKRSRCSGNSSKELEGQKTHQQHLLNKTEKEGIMIHINGLNVQQVTLVCLSRALQQLSTINNSNLSEFCGIVTATELSFSLNIYRRPS